MLKGRMRPFPKVGEDTFHQELVLKMLVKLLKEVKKQMIQTVTGDSKSQQRW